MCLWLVLSTSVYVISNLWVSYWLISLLVSSPFYFLLLSSCAFGFESQNISCGFICQSFFICSPYLCTVKLYITSITYLLQSTLIFQLSIILSICCMFASKYQSVMYMAMLLYFLASSLQCQALCNFNNFTCCMLHYFFSLSLFCPFVVFWLLSISFKFMCQCFFFLYSPLYF